MGRTGKTRKVKEVIRREPDIRAEKDHVVAVFDLGPVGPNGQGMTIGVRFESPEQLMEFSSRLMDKAVLVWPEHHLCKEYQSE